MSDVLVTGGTGLVGSSLLKYLISNSHNVTLLTRNPKVETNHERLSVVLEDITAPNYKRATLEAIERAEGIIHCAAKIPGTNPNKNIVDYYNSNTLASLRLADLAKEKNLSFFVFLSTFSLFAPDEKTIGEDTTINPQNPYALTKLAAEQYINLISKQGSTDFYTLRISAPYGPYFRQRSVIPIFIENALQSKPITILGSGNRRQTFTQVADIARAIEKCFTAKKPGIYNIAGNRPVTMLELAEAAIAAVKDTGSTIEFSGKDDPNEKENRNILLGKVRKALGWVPNIDINQGIELTVAQLQDRSLLPFVIRE